jgi:branched-chain amino acid transport system substrate-binding protein
MFAPRRLVNATITNNTREDLEMNRSGSIDRRRILKAGAAGAAAVLAPAGMCRARAASGNIKIGVPTAITGTYAEMGNMVMRTCKLVAKEAQEQGGVLGKQLEFVFEDTGGVPANCVRKTQEMVERDGINIFTGIMASSEALAVSAKLPEWNAFFISSINGAGELTGEKFVPNFCRANISAPMGSRAVTRYLADAPQKTFYGIGVDQAWGHSSLKVFAAEIQKQGKQFLGQVVAPTGTKDYSSYIARVREQNPDGLYVVFAGDDAITFHKQAAQFGLSEKTQMFTELVDIMTLRPTGDATVGLIGASRYAFTIDTPENAAFVKRFQAEHQTVPDTYDGEQYQALKALIGAIEKVKSTETAALIKAVDNLEITSVKGKVVIRDCDHQGVQPGFIVKVEKREGFSFPVPQVIKTYPPEDVMPACRRSTFG